MQSYADPKEDRAAELIPPVRPIAPWRVAGVEALPGFRLRVHFNDGTEGAIEMAEFIQSNRAGVFAVLRDEKLFRQARVVLGAVTWPGELDLAPDAMHRAIKESGTWVINEEREPRCYRPRKFCKTVAIRELTYVALPAAN